MPRIANYLGWPKSGGACLLCGAGTEDTIHFLAVCPALLHCRKRFFRELQGLHQFGTPGTFVLIKASRAESPQDLTELLLSDGAFSFPCSYATAEYANYCALSRWYLDRAVKNCLMAMWRCRAAAVGSFAPAGGSMYHIPPAAGSFSAAIAAQQKECSSVPIPLRRVWRPWKPPQAREGAINWSRRSRSTARNFFVVWRGWKTGVFYQWRDCKRAIQGFAGAQFKGFQTLDGAEEAFAGGNAA